ncbi:hypothetical protein GQ42DRAFT_24685 [Ramicandelaber brevisporus]|nr:hypothetical protein GQ42DRAFT_24685 [Ramicandelaber brevisporus]
MSSTVNCSPVQHVEALHALADQLLSTASQLAACPSADGSQPEDAIAAAIQALELALSPDVTTLLASAANKDVLASSISTPSIALEQTGLLSPNSELRTRCRLAELYLMYTQCWDAIDAHLRKAETLCRNLRIRDYTLLDIEQLQCELQLRQSNATAESARMAAVVVPSDSNSVNNPQSAIGQYNLASQAYTALIQSAKNMGEYAYVYHGQMKLSTIASNVNNMRDLLYAQIKQSGSGGSNDIVPVQLLEMPLHNAIIASAERGDVGALRCLSMVLAQHHMSTCRLQEAGNVLDRLTLHFEPSDGSAPLTKVEDGSLQIKAWYLLLRSLHYLANGDHDGAAKYTSLMIKAANEWSSSVQPASDDGVVTIKLSKSSTVPLVIRWMASTQYKLTALCLSGISAKGSSATQATAALRRFNEALDIISAAESCDTPHWKNACDANDALRYLVQTRIHIQLHIVDIHVQLGDASAAEDALEVALQLIHDNGMLATFGAMACIRWSLVSLTKGKFGSAVEYMHAAALASNDINNWHLCILCWLCVAALGFASSDPEHHKLARSVMETKCSVIIRVDRNDLPSPLRVLYDLLNAAMSMSMSMNMSAQEQRSERTLSVDAPVVLETKAKILNCLNACSSTSHVLLKSQTLALLGLLISDTDPDMASKSLISAQRLVSSYGRSSASLVNLVGKIRAELSARHPQLTLSDATTTPARSSAKTPAKKTRTK